MIPPFVWKNRAESTSRARGSLIHALCAFLALAIVAGAAADEAGDRPLTREDFSVGRLLLVEDPGGLQSVDLDFDVYRRSVEPRLADLRVFDSGGRPIPYAIRPQWADREPERIVEEVPLFHLAGPSGGKSHTLGGDDRLEAEISATGAIIQIHRAPRVGEEASQTGRTAQWLLDTSGLDRSLVGLEFDFLEEGGDFISRVELARSDDLATWKPVDTDWVVARLDQNGHKIERTRFELPHVRARYLRLTPIRADALPTLRGVRVEHVGESGEGVARNERERFEGHVESDSPEIVLFDAEAELPILALQLRLTEPGTLVEGRLESSHTAEGPWTFHGDHLFYFYEHDGLVFRNPKLPWNHGRRRFIRVVTSPRGGGLQGAIPRLEIEWRPEQLVYLDRGPGPAVLVVGRAGTEASSFTYAELSGTSRSRVEDLGESTARLGPEHVLAGERALERPVSVPWRTYALWMLLIGAVGTVLVLSIRLMGARGAEGEDGPEAP